jgi:hypothetical protein
MFWYLPCTYLTACICSYLLASFRDKQILVRQPRGDILLLFLVFTHLSRNAKIEEVDEKPQPKKRMGIYENVNNMMTQVNTRSTTLSLEVVA